MKVRAKVVIASIVVVLASWQLAGQLGVVDVRYTSVPTAIAGAGIELARSGELWSNASLTLLEFLVGFVLAVVVGVPLGMLMGWRLRLRQTLEPALVALYVTPSLA
ncbi:MAG: hypothetical protein J2P20_01200, partial [Pseudonocardia sp.]|nr:hypothetical protein [Pseudonocardia sp.]